MLTDLSMVLILCGKLLRKWASEFEWGMWRNIEWGIGIGVTAVGVLGIAAALYLVWKFRKNTGNSKMTAFAGSEPEKAGKTAKSSEGAAADKSETDEIEKSRQMQFEARAAAEAEKEQLFLKKSEKVPNELLVLVGGFAFFGWLQPLRHSYARYRIVAEWGTVIECVQTGLLFFGICGVFLLSAGILVCRYEKKQLREMSFFYRERKRYRDRTSLERQLAGQSKWPFRVALIAELLIVITITGLINGMDGEVLSVILLGLTTLILILFAWKTYRSRLNREIGLLMEQIHTMAEGIMESRIHEISEKSLLYPAFAELENIESAMQKSVEKQMQAERLKIERSENPAHLDGRLYGSSEKRGSDTGGTGLRRSDFCETGTAKGDDPKPLRALQIDKRNRKIPDGKNGYETVDRADPRRYGRCDCAEQSVVPHGTRRRAASVPWG